MIGNFKNPRQPNVNYCNCQEDDDCWNLGLWSTEGKTYSEWISRLISTIIKYCYTNGNNLTYYIFVFIYFCIYLFINFEHYAYRSYVT